MLDGLSWTEMLVIGVVALIVVGPKELPQLLRTVGQWFGKVKKMARDFQRQLDDAVRDEELSELRKQVSELHRTTTSDLNRGLKPTPDRHLPRRTVTVDGKVMPAPEMVQQRIGPPAPPGSPDAPLDVPDAAAPPAVTAPAMESVPEPATAGGDR